MHQYAPVCTSMHRYALVCPNVYKMGICVLKFTGLKLHVQFMFTAKLKGHYILSDLTRLSRGMSGQHCKQK